MSKNGSNLISFIKEMKTFKVAASLEINNLKRICEKAALTTTSLLDDVVRLQNDLARLHDLALSEDGPDKNGL